MNFLTNGLLENAGGPKKKKPKMLQHGQKKKKTYEERPFNVDFYVGYGFNYASGDYLAYQKSYALLGSDVYKITSETSDFNAPVFGGQMRGFPFMDYEDWKSALSGIFGVGYMRKGFDNQVTLTNTGLPYSDVTQIKENFRASFVTSYFMVRYGRLIFGEVGFVMDWFVSGSRTQEITRTTSGDNVYIEPFTTTGSTTFSLDGKTMSRVGLGWMAGIGYQIHPLAGLRVTANMNSNFFKEKPDLTNFQPAIHAFVTLN